LECEASGQSREYGYQLFNTRLESSPVSRHTMDQYKIAADIAVTVLAVVGLVLCTGTTTLYTKRYKKLWNHSVPVAVTTIILIRCVWVYFSVTFLSFIDQI